MTVDELDDNCCTTPSAGNLMDSKTSHLDDLLRDRLENAFHYETATIQLQHVAKIAAEHSAVDLAYAAARLPLDVRSVVYQHLPHWEAKVDFFVNTDPNTRTAVYRALSDLEVKGLIEEMPDDEAVEVLDNLPGRRLRRLLDALDEKRAQSIRELRAHERHSAARMMTNEFFAFPSQMSVGEAAAYIREHPGVDFTHTIFIVSALGELEGCVPARSLIVNKGEIPLARLMRPVAHTACPDSTREEVVDLVERYKVSALPVIDQQQILVGVVTYEAVVETLEDMADETIAQMAGTMEKVDSCDPIWKRFFARAPWLVVTLCGGLLNAMSISYFEGTMAPWLGFILFFVPLITGMSGNVGIVCSTVLVRGMAIGALSSGSKREVVLKEMSLGALTGLAFGLLCGVLVFGLNAFGLHALGDNPLAASVIVGSGLFGACLTATCLGVFSPLFFARLGVDPAISSGPIVTAFNDVFSMLIYFLIAQSVSLTLFS